MPPALVSYNFHTPPAANVSFPLRVSRAAFLFRLSLLPLRDTLKSADPRQDCDGTRLRRVRRILVSLPQCPCHLGMPYQQPDSVAKAPYRRRRSVQDGMPLMEDVSGNSRRFRAYPSTSDHSAKITVFPTSGDVPRSHGGLVRNADPVGVHSERRPPPLRISSEHPAPSLATNRDFHPSEPT